MTIPRWLCVAFLAGQAVVYASIELFLPLVIILLVGHLSSHNEKSF